jgi:fluoroquinolone transport system permease protein
MKFRLLRNSLLADIKFIFRDPMLLMACLAPLILIILLKFIFPLISELITSKTGFNLDPYYSVVAITMVSVIPMLFGMVYAFILLDESDAHILQVISVTPAGRKNFLLMRIIVPSVLTSILVLVTAFITGSVPTEGWLRTIFISVLMGFQTVFVFLFIGGIAGNKVEGLALAKLYGIFLVTVPLGLLLHHPWNYLNFFSPLYWISWAWVCQNPFESLLYGVIAMVITSGSVWWLFRHFLRKHAN